MMDGRNQVKNGITGVLTVEEIDARIGRLARALAHRVGVAPGGQARPVWITPARLVSLMQPFVSRN